MSSPINLDNYFERIGYDGPSTATMETLQILPEVPELEKKLAQIVAPKEIVL